MIKKVNIGGHVTMNNKADLLKKTELKKVKPFPKFVISLLDRKSVV